MRPPYEEWGHLLINILIKHWLAEQKMLGFFLVFGVMDSPSFLSCVGSLASDRQERAMSGGQAACASGRAHPCYHIPQASLSPGLLWGRASSGVSGGQCCLWLAAPRGSWGVLSALHFLVLALLSRGRSGCDERGSGNIFLCQRSCA